MKRVRLAALSVVAVLILAFAAAGWDFVRFVNRADASLSTGPVPPAEAVTALTGASDARIIAALNLAQARDLPLLISGVHIDTTAADIAAIAGLPEGDIVCCVTLGRAAATTEGNGAEVADWARRQQVTEIIVVTSEYHMDRALVELRRAMPEGNFIPLAVSSLPARPRDWWRNPDLAGRLFEEWAKFRIASLRARPSASASSTATERSSAG